MKLSLNFSYLTYKELWLVIKYYLEILGFDLFRFIYIQTNAKMCAFDNDVGCDNGKTLCIHFFVLFCNSFSKTISNYLYFPPTIKIEKVHKLLNIKWFKILKRFWLFLTKYSIDNFQYL